MIVADHTLAGAIVKTARQCVAEVSAHQLIHV
jgi:hypothetical protein